MEQKGRIRVAIVGSGMAGLVTAYLINGDAQSRYAVTLFEGASYANQQSFSPALVTLTQPRAMYSLWILLHFLFRTIIEDALTVLTSLCEHLPADSIKT